MTARIPLFSLPPNVAETLLKDLNFGDLFELSQLSKKAFDLVRNTVRLYKGNVSLDIRLYSSKYVALMWKTGRCVLWSFYGKRDFERYDLENFEQRVVKIDSGSGASSYLTFAQNLEGDYGCASDSIEDVFLLIQYLAELFNANMKQLVVGGSQIPNLGPIQSLPLLRKSKRVALAKGTVSHEDIRRFLEGFECDAMQVQCSPERNSGYDFHSFIGEIEITNGEWFKGAMLSELNCHHFFLKSCTLTDEDINTFINQWVAGTNKKTPRTILLLQYHPNHESFGVYRENRKQQWNLDKIFHDLSITQQPTPSRPATINTTVHREIDDQKLNIALFRFSNLPDPALLIQSDFNPVDNTICPLVYFSRPFRRRALERL